jgi:hypothetical protein
MQNDFFWMVLATITGIWIVGFSTVAAGVIIESARRGLFSDLNGIAASVLMLLRATVFWPVMMMMTYIGHRVSEHMLGMTPVEPQNVPPEVKAAMDEAMKEAAKQSGADPNATARVRVYTINRRKEEREEGLRGKDDPP